MKILRKLALISFILAVVVSGVAYFYYQGSDFSEADFRLEVRGPEEVEAGEVVNYTVRYRNNSDIRLENVQVTFEYPEAAIPLNAKGNLKEGAETFRRKKQLADLNPGQAETLDFKARILGKEGTELKAKAWFEYTPHSLNATYEAERSHSVLIKEVPFTFELDIPEEMKADQEFPFQIRYFSNLGEDLTDLTIKADYPSQFEFTRSTPTGLEENEWEQKTLPSKEGGVIEVFGKLTGDPGDIQGFSAELGVWEKDQFYPLKSVQKEVLIPQSNFFVDVLINDQSDYVANPGEDLLYNIFLKNTGDEILKELFVSAELDKEMTDVEEVEAMKGRFQPAAGSIIWSHSSVSQLRELYPDEEAEISFWSKVKEEDLPYNPELSTIFDLEQTRIEKTTKINTDLELNQTVKPKEDPFDSEAQLPFEPNKPSSFTVKWELKNHYNNVNNLAITTSLPEEAAVVENEAEEGDFVYNSQTDKLIWSFEEVKKGAGTEHQAPVVYFQVEVLPHTSLDKDFKLLDELTIIGTDNWTEEKINFDKEPLRYGELLETFEVDSLEEPLE